jgi:opacity protein-like surface antigen
MRKYSLILVALFLVPVAVFAQNNGDEDWRRGHQPSYRDTPSPHAFELTPFIGYRWGGTIFADQTAFAFHQDVDVASSANYGVNFGIPLADTGMKLELMINRQNSHLQTEEGLFQPEDKIADVDVTYWHAGLQMPFAVSHNAVPYVVISGGIATIDPKVSQLTAENKFSFSTGIGVKVPISRNVAMRAEGRGYFTFLDDSNSSCHCDYYYYNQNFYQGEVNLGFTFSF